MTISRSTMSELVRTLQAAPAPVEDLNVVGLQRGGVPEHEIDELKRVYHELFRKQAAVAAAVAQVEATAGSLAAELVQFVREWTSAPSGRYLEQFRTDRPATRA